MIFNLQRYSTHDGPGIRSVVFLKGCPLSCRWCQNPESRSRRANLLYDPRRCGSEVDPDDIMAEVLRDKPFYLHSGGGLTLSGGEPFMQPQLAAELLLAAKQHPEQYRDLVVRVAGYSAFFIALSPDAQDDIIARTEHTL